MNADLEIDAIGLLCPLPVLRARKALQGLPSGGILRLESDDPVAVIDLPHFCAEQGHDLLKHETAPNSDVFWIRKTV